ncbi:unnamed protein product [Brassica oleracea var. botrytis]
MPSGAKKRKALKKKKQLEAFGACPSNKGINDHGILNTSMYDEHGSQDEGESDGNLSSPGSQGNGEFWTRDPSPSPLSGLGKSTVKEKTEDANAPQGQEAIDEGFTALGREQAKRRMVWTKASKLKFRILSSISLMKVKRSIDQKKQRRVAFQYLKCQKQAQMSRV